jgi:hypothetical protein
MGLVVSRANLGEALPHFSMGRSRPNVGRAAIDVLVEKRILRLSQTFGDTLDAMGSSPS